MQLSEEQIVLTELAKAKIQIWRRNQEKEWKILLENLPTLTPYYESLLSDWIFNSKEDEDFESIEAKFIR